jgi:hypothetical protein
MDVIQYHPALQLIRRRDDRIRTCGPYVPNVVRYRAALHPEISLCTLSAFYKTKLIAIFEKFEALRVPDPGFL